MNHFINSFKHFLLFILEHRSSVGAPIFTYKKTAHIPKDQHLKGFEHRAPVFAKGPSGNIAAAAHLRLFLSLSGLSLQCTGVKIKKGGI